MTLAGIQYIGLAGVSSSCKRAIVRLIQFGDEIHKASLLSCPGTHSTTHCFLLRVNCDEIIAVKSGFASGYGGEGLGALSTILRLFERHNVEIDEYIVSPSIIDRVNQSGLTKKDLDQIQAMQPVRPNRWYDYIFDEKYEKQKNGTSDLKIQFPPVMPYAILDNRIIDLALEFQVKPDHSILSGYRRLEGIIRDRIGSEEHGAKLFSLAFQGENSKLLWKDLGTGEQQGRVNLFTGVYMAFRNPRAHHEPHKYAEGPLSEFLLLNQLYILEKEAIVREEA